MFFCFLSSARRRHKHADTMNELVSLCLSTPNGVLSLLSRFMRYDKTDDWCGHVTHRVRAMEVAHDARRTVFNERHAVTESVFQVTLEMYTGSVAPQRPLLQSITYIGFSFRVLTRLDASELLCTLRHKLTSTNLRVHVKSVEQTDMSTFIAHCKIFDEWEVPAICIDDSDTKIIAFADGTNGPRVDKIELSVWAVTRAIEILRNCDIPGVVVNRWHGSGYEPHKRSKCNERNAAHTLVQFAKSAIFFE